MECFVFFFFSLSCYVGCVITAIEIWLTEIPLSFWGNFLLFLVCWFFLIMKVYWILFDAFSVSIKMIMRFFFANVALFLLSHPCILWVNLIDYCFYVWRFPISWSQFWETGFLRICSFIWIIQLVFQLLFRFFPSVKLAEVEHHCFKNVKFESVAEHQCDDGVVMEVA